MAANVEVRVAPFEQLPSNVLYGVLRLRSEVFVVEQQCVFQDMDGRDTEPDALHLWVEEDGAVVGAARLLRNRDGSQHIGRVVTDQAHRGAGVGAALMRHALQLCDGDVDIKAQSRLCDWYAHFGFAPYGDEFDEDGIPHQRMRSRVTR